MGIFFFITFIYTDKILALKSASLHSLPVKGNPVTIELISLINIKLFIHA